ncbi:MAG: family 10 glycosylhydrolase [Eubacterium sp.]|nr:family 10 glycosylhydrolase [Eubacterium sp.]
MLTFSGCSLQSKTNTAPPQFTEVKEQKSNDLYVKSIWLTYYELDNMAKGKTKSEFKENISAAFKRLSNMDFNTVTVQVRAFADAVYESKYFKSRYSFDALEIMCEVAEKHNLRLEAWVNPYRVSFDKNKKVSFDSTMLYKSGQGIYFNPASDKVTKLIKKGVVEIVRNYNIYAIHFDDYFYPTTSKKIDKAEYSAYLKKGGKKSLSAWRRDKINNMVKTVYKAVKRTDSAVKFGISPSSNIKNDFETLYADVEKWAKGGYCDYICPQIYFGFKNVYQPFMFTTKKWIGITSCDLYVGLPLYKAGRADKYAALEDKSVINEFKNNDNIISRQITYLSKLDEVKGFYIFSYSCLDDSRCKKEVDNMLKVLK